MTFFGGGRAGVHFVSIDDIDNKHIVHKACCSWSAGQDIQYVPPEKRRTAETYSKLTYTELIHEHYKRVSFICYFFIMFFADIGRRGQVTNILSVVEVNPWTGVAKQAA